MTSTSERRVVFLDATVLAAPTTRSIILFSQLHEDADYIAKWSLKAEEEADIALIRRSGEHGEKLGRTITPVLVSELRAKTAWGRDVIVPAAPELEDILSDTEANDRHIAAAASAAGASFLIPEICQSCIRIDKWKATPIWALFTPASSTPAFSDRTWGRGRDVGSLGRWWGVVRVR